ncbi:MAG: N-acetylmuramoyl-L-alanine amidase [Phycisphaeraceae bacterium]|nr:N-acetylmuramoyl-L-alanine amidase [Phycisphaeraceae bacterium]
MDSSRREFLLGSAALLIAGCAGDGATSGRSRPGPEWPSLAGRPIPTGPATVAPWQRASQAASPPYPSSASAHPAPSAAATAGLGLPVLTRGQWTRTGPIASRLNPMGGVHRITVHHEGWTPVWFTGTGETAERLESIRRAHVGKGWADIGYHYVIDRAGRVWQGRDVRYQGAHVQQNNENNVGVMLLGNFEQQKPSSSQMVTVVDVLRSLMRQYKVPIKRVYTHRELKPTICPGKSLQPQMVKMRKGSALA